MMFMKFQLCAISNDKDETQISYENDKYELLL